MATVAIKFRDIAQGTLPPVCVCCGRPAVAKRFSWLSDPKAASKCVSSRKGLLWFWAFVLWKQYVRAEPPGKEAGLPFCDRHREYWPRRAWLIVGGFLVLMVLIALMCATDSGSFGSDRRHVPNLFSTLAGAWFLI